MKVSSVVVVHAWVDQIYQVPMKQSRTCWVSSSCKNFWVWWWQHSTPLCSNHVPVLLHFLFFSLNTYWRATTAQLSVSQGCLSCCLSDLVQIFAWNDILRQLWQVRQAFFFKFAGRKTEKLWFAHKNPKSKTPVSAVSAVSKCHFKGIFALKHWDTSWDTHETPNCAVYMLWNDKK